MDRNRGGLGLPDIRKYYLAFNARYPLKWAFHNDFTPTPWEIIEQEVLDMNKCSLYHSALKRQSEILVRDKESYHKIAFNLHKTMGFVGI